MAALEASMREKHWSEYQTLGTRLPATHFHSIFSCAIFHNLSQLTERQDEASPSVTKLKNDRVRPRGDDLLARTNKLLRTVERN